MPGPDLTAYITVPERIAQFRQQYPDGCLRPVDPSDPFKVVVIGDKTFIAYAAEAYRSPDDQRPGIGVAWEPFPGRTPYTRDSELMNAETSAWGRAIVAVLAADTNSGIATAEEIRNRQEDPPKRSAPSAGNYSTAQDLVTAAHSAATAEQVRAHYKAAGTNGWLKHEAAHPESGEKVIVEDFLTQRGNDLKHSKSHSAAAGSLSGKPGDK